MLLLPLSTPLLRPGDDLADAILSAHRSPAPFRKVRDEDGSGAKDIAVAQSLQEYAAVAGLSLGARGMTDATQETLLPGDILVLSSKVLATIEGAMIDLRLPSPIAMGEGSGVRAYGTRALELSRQTGRSPSFCAAMLRELRRLNGKVISAVPGAALTEVWPQGMTQGSILVANAGLDESNAPAGFAIGWPREPVMSARKLREELEKRITDYGLRKKSSEIRNPQSAIGIILSDSVCVPRRNGVTALALVCSGIDPLQSQKGKRDLFGKPLQITTEAIADQLATAGNFVMGNAAQSIPAVIVRDHGLTLSEWEGWVPGIELENDLFRSVSEEQNIKHVHGWSRAPGG